MIDAMLELASAFSYSLGLTQLHLEMQRGEHQNRPYNLCLLTN